MNLECKITIKSHITGTQIVKDSLKVSQEPDFLYSLASVSFPNQRGGVLTLPNLTLTGDNE